MSDPKIGYIRIVNQTFDIKRELQSARIYTSRCAGGGGYAKE